MSRLFTVASDDAVIDLINAAKDRLVLLSPGFSTKVAKAIAKRLDAPGSPTIVSIIVDADPEVCRLGYGEIQAIEILKQTLAKRGQEVLIQPGVRIGLVVSDLEIVVFSPTPQLIEAGSTSEIKPNAIRITNQVASDVASACGAVKVGEPVRPKEVGVQSLDQNTLDSTKKSLEEIPPRRFDTARRERVFSYKLEFVEFSIEGFKLATRAVQLPPELLGLDEDVDQWHNTFRLFPSSSLPKVEIDAEDGKKRELGERALSAAADALRKKFLISLPGYGWLILVRNKAAFESAVETLRADLKTYKKQIDDQLNTLRTTSTDRLIELLLPRVREKIPERWSIQAIIFPLTDDDLRDRLRWDLEMAVLRASDTFMPEVKCLFKGVTYGTIKADEHFQEAIAKAFGKNAAAQLLNERDVTEAKDHAPVAPKNP